MHPIRLRKMLFLLFLAVALGLATFLVLIALRQNINLFYTPTELVNNKQVINKPIRIGGMVVKGSVRRSADKLTVWFALTDFKETVEVKYRGTLPDLFREGQGIVALGTLVDNRHVTATEVLAKHDANYMPPEVKAALAAAKGNKEQG